MSNREHENRKSSVIGFIATDSCVNVVFQIFHGTLFHGFLCMKGNKTISTVKNHTCDGFQSCLKSLKIQSHVIFLVQIIVSVKNAKLE